MRCRGFLLGATAGRTTLNGEGLQHQDGQSHLQASIVPNLVSLRSCVCLRDRRHHAGRHSPDVSRTTKTLSTTSRCKTKPTRCRRCPRARAKASSKGMYKLRNAPAGVTGPQSAASSAATSILREALRAQETSGENCGVAADVWSVTSYSELRREALACERWNMLHPTEAPKLSYLEKTLANEKGVFVAASDYVKATTEMISPLGARRLVSARHRWLRPQSDDRPVLAPALRSRCRVHHRRGAVAIGRTKRSPGDDRRQGDPRV